MYGGRKTLDAVFKEFIQRRGQYKGWSQTTYDKYAKEHLHLESHLQTVQPFVAREHIYVDLLTEDHFLGFMEYYTHLARGSHDVVLGRVKVFCQYLHENGYTQTHLSRNIAKRQKGTDDTLHEPQYIPAEERDLVAEAMGDEHISRKYLCLVQWYGGRRIGEVTSSLRVRDVDFTPTSLFKHGSYVYVNHKRGGVAERQPLGTKLRGILEEWFPIYLRLAKEEGLLPKNAEKLPGDWFLFPTTAGRGKAPRGGKRTLVINPFKGVYAAHKILNRNLRRLGLYAPWKATHGSRRAAADSLMEQTGDIRVVQAFLGHKDQATTERYLSRTREKVALSNALETAWTEKEPEPTVTEQDDMPSVVTNLADWKRAR